MDLMTGFLVAISIFFYSTQPRSNRNPKKKRFRLSNKLIPLQLIYHIFLVWLHTLHFNLTFNFQPRPLVVPVTAAKPETPRPASSVHRRRRGMAAYMFTGTPPGGQVARLSVGQVARWPGGQVARWSGGEGHSVPKLEPEPDCKVQGEPWIRQLPD